MLAYADPVLEPQATWGGGGAVAEHAAERDSGRGSGVCRPQPDAVSGASEAHLPYRTIPLLPPAPKALGPDSKNTSQINISHISNPDVAPF